MEFPLAYHQGYDAYQNPRRGRENPYQNGTEQDAEWRAGFIHAQSDHFQVETHSPMPAPASAPVQCELDVIPDHQTVSLIEIAQ